MACSFESTGHSVYMMTDSTSYLPGNMDRNITIYASTINNFLKLVTWSLPSE
jgi:hypothetical protein